jgi:uncharacterized protein YbjT (DUF2867 family)
VCSRVSSGAVAVILLTGATGYVGGQLLPRLLEGGHEVRALVRNPRKRTLPDGAQVVQGDALSGEGLDDALAGTDVAYYLIHSMGGGGSGGFADRDEQAARNFARAATKGGTAKIVYLGGLPSNNGHDSEHLRSRHRTAEVLGEEGPDLAYARAAMVLGAGSSSYDMLLRLVHRLPLMVTPSWVDTKSQPIAIEDVVAALAALGEREDVAGEVQLGGGDVLTYRDMMRRFARLENRRQPTMVPTPFLSPKLSSYWVQLITRADGGLVRPLVDGLRSEMVVQTPPPAGINDDPLGFDDAVRRAQRSS